jgi:hypothetical protein
MSTSPERRKTRRLPYPTTITIYNLFPYPDTNKSSSLQEQQQQQRGWFRRHHEYSMSLLPRDIWLDIYVNRKNNNNNIHNNGASSSLHRVHRTVNRSRRICPAFTHIDEAMKHTYWGTNPSPEEYESMRVRVSYCSCASSATTTSVSKNATTVALPNDDKDNYDDIPIPQEQHSSIPDEKNENTTTTNMTCFLEAYIHPNMLCRVDQLPTILPINCLVIAFTDGTLRMHPAQYHLLLDNLLIAKPNNHRDDTNTKGGASRFEDSTFDQLLPTTTSSCVPEDEFSSIVQNGLIPSPASSSSSPRTKGNEAMGTNILWDSDSHGFEAEELTNENQTKLINREQQQLHLERNGDKTERRHPVQQVDFVVDDTCASNNNSMDEAKRDVGEIDLRNLVRQTQSLEHCVREEEEALHRETTQLETDRELVRGWVRDIAAYHQRDVDIQRVLSSNTVEIQRLEFILEAQKIRLIQELARIYPITHLTASTMLQQQQQQQQQQSRWFIRGLELPSDIYTGTEDVVSASLGFLCHCVHLMSKYLGIYVRYRLHCQGSRSAIQDERGSVFPLFVSRTVEREQVEYALHLLDLDITCICQTRRIEMHPEKIHILAKVKRIYVHFIKGQ